MSNPHRGELEIEVGGRKRKLRYSLNTLVKLQNRFGGKPLMDILAEIEKLNVEVILALLHLGLLEDDKDLTEDQVSNFDDINLTKVSATIGKALGLALGAPEGE